MANLKKSNKTPDAPVDLSEFPDSKIAVGAALTYIEQLQKSLPQHKYAHILDLLNNYYTHHLTEKNVYQHFKHIVKGEPGEEELVKGFVRFLPEGAVVEEEVAKEEEAEEGEEGKTERVKKDGSEGVKRGEGGGGRVIEDVTEEEDEREKGKKEVVGKK